MSARRRVLVVGSPTPRHGSSSTVGGVGVLRRLQRLLREGVRAPLRSTLPALTPPGWTSAATGRNPASTTSSTLQGDGGRHRARAPVTLGDSEPAPCGTARAPRAQSCVLHIALTYPPQEPSAS